MSVAGAPVAVPAFRQGDAGAMWPVESSRGSAETLAAMPGRAFTCDSVSAVERIHPLQAVHVHVDESRDDVVTVKRERRGFVAAGERVAPNLRDSTVVDDERPRRQEPVGQHERRAGEDDLGHLVIE